MGRPIKATSIALGDQVHHAKLAEPFRNQAAAAQLFQLLFHPAASFQGITPLVKQLSGCNGLSRPDTVWHTEMTLKAR